MDVELSRSDFLHKLNHRIEVLQSISAESKGKPDLVEELDHSRSTIDRAIYDLEDMELARRNTQGDCEITNLGYVILDIHANYIQTVLRIHEGKELFDHFTPDKVPSNFFRSVELSRSQDSVPESTLQPLVEEIMKADRVDVAFGSVTIYYLRLLNEQSVKQGFDLKVILSKDVIESLLEFSSPEFSRMVSHNSTDVHLTEKTIPFNVWLVTSPQEDYLAIVLHDDGGIRGILANRDQCVIEWGRDFLTEYIDQAELYSE